MADATSAPGAKAGAAEPILPGDAAGTESAKHVAPDPSKTAGDVTTAEGQPQSATPQGNQPGAHAEGKKENAPTEGDALVDAAMTGSGAPPEAQAQDAAGNPVEKLTAERDLHDLDGDEENANGEREPKAYPEPKVHSTVTQDNVSEPGVQTTTEHLKDDAASHHYGDERDYKAPLGETVDPDPTTEADVDPTN
jgi:hypothetical protein